MRGVVADLILPNPEYVSRTRLNKWTGDIPHEICIAGQYGETLELPRGYLETLMRKIEAAGDVPVIEDRRLKFPSLDLRFHGELRPYQSKALEVMTRHGSGILVAPCGSGKTALGMAMIAHWKQPALVLVHTKDLLKQTREAARRWLDIESGIIGGGKYSLGPVTVATVQSFHANPEFLNKAKVHFWPCPAVRSTPRTRDNLHGGYAEIPCRVPLRTDGDAGTPGWSDPISGGSCRACPSQDYSRESGSSGGIGHASNRVDKDRLHLFPLPGVE
jgi:hypothetical protein